MSAIIFLYNAYSLYKPPQKIFYIYIFLSWSTFFFVYPYQVI